MGYPSIHFPQVDSTNLEAKRLIDSGEAMHGLLISADFQTQGRGQLGRDWHSEEAQNAMLSIVLAPQALSVKSQFSLNIIASLAVAEVIEDYGLQVQVKWPNDIYVSDNKICGILIQNFLQGDIIQHAIIGIGLNVNQLTWPKEVPNPTSLALELSKSLDRLEIINSIAHSVMARYNAIAHDNNQLRKPYLDKLYRRGEISQFEVAGELIHGEIIGIDDTGQLMVAHDNVLKAYQHGDISLVL